jgi:hypothetical protein
MFILQHLLYQISSWIYGDCRSLVLICLSDGNICFSLPRNREDCSFWHLCHLRLAGFRLKLLFSSNHDLLWFYNGILHLLVLYCFWVLSAVIKVNNEPLLPLLWL